MLTLITVSPDFLLGQSPAFINYNQSNGLPSNEAYYVYQDHQGFVWMSTDNGAVRFDGHDFMLYNKQNGMADNVNFAIYSDSKHRLWFRSYSGAVTIYDSGEVIRHPLNNLILELQGKNIMHSMSIDKSNRAYLPLAGRILVIDENNNYRIEPLPEKSLVIRSVEGSDPIVLHQYNITDVKQVVYDGKSLPIQNYIKPSRSGLAGVKVFMGKTYFFVDSNLYEINASGFKKVAETKQPIISLSIIHNRMWLGLKSGGLNVYDGQHLKHLNFDVLDELSVTSTLQDINNGIWISTLERGVFYFPNISIANYHYPFNSKINAVTFGDDCAYFGNYDGSLYKFSPSSGSYQLINRYESPVVGILYVPSKKNLFVSTGSNSYILNTQEKSNEKALLAKEVVYGLKTFS